MHSYQKIYSPYTLIAFFCILFLINGLNSESVLRLNGPLSGFKIPMFGESGYKNSQIEGIRGEYINEDLIEVESMKLETFSENGSLETTLQSPIASINLNHKQAKSQASIAITGPGYNVEGQSWEWDGQTHSIHIHKEVVVSFQNTQAINAPASSKTIIKSQELKIEEKKDENYFYFLGDVEIQSDSFEAQSQSLYVVCQKDAEGSKHTLGQIQYMKATESVKIRREGEYATCEEAEVYPEEEKLILSQNPILENQKGKVTGHRITLLKGNEQAIIEGGCSQERPKIYLNKLPTPPKEDETFLTE